MPDIHYYELGIVEREPYCSTPFSRLLFRTYNGLLYVQPTCEPWHNWFTHDDFGNLVRVNLTSVLVYKRQGDTLLA